MKISTRIAGVDCKIGRRSRTGSTVSMSVSDEQAIDCVQYFQDYEKGIKPTGKLKKVELVMYYDDDEASNDIDSKLLEMDTELDNAIKSDNLSNNSQTTANDGYRSGLDIFEDGINGNN